jgi:hypothetical protein
VTSVITPTDICGCDLDETADISSYPTPKRKITASCCPNPATFSMRVSVPQIYTLGMTEVLEDASDVAAFDVSMAEDGENIPWDQVKAELGWT